MPKAKKRLTALLLALAVAAGAVLLYCLPKTFLRGVTPAEVCRISVFDGSTGVGFSVEEPEAIRHIVETVQSVKLKREGLSLGYMGYGLRMSFVGEGDRELAVFDLNGEDTVRKDPFFYRCEGGLPVAYVRELEKTSAGE